MIKKIKLFKSQELATHTFSHFYCLEQNSNEYSFKDDIIKAIEKAKTQDIEIKSIIFPRNQYDNESLKECYKQGIVAFRGNENNFLQKPRNQKKLNFY